MNLPSAGGRSAASVAVLCGAGLVPSLLATAPIPVLAELAAVLGSDSDSASWILTAMFVSAAVTTPIAGRAADLYGGRRVLLVTTALVTLGSVICAVADALPMMAVGRAMTGAGAGAIPVGIGLMRVVVGPAALRMGTAAMSVTVGVGGALALPVSAVLARCGGPQLIFWVAAGVGLCLFCGIVGLIPVDPPRPVRRQRFDVAGALGLVVTLPLLLVVPARLPYWGVLTVPDPPRLFRRAQVVSAPSGLRVRM
ncbi:MFS transporter [Gordonia sp. NPDC003950]